MERIQRLPFLLGCLAAMAVGIANYMIGADNQTIFLRMAVVMTIFFIIGVYVRNTILSIKEEILEKERERIRDEELRAKQEHDRQKAAAEASKYQQVPKGHNQAQTGQKVDLVAEDTTDEFQPMTVSRVISSKVKE